MGIRPHLFSGQGASDRRVSEYPVPSPQVFYDLPQDHISSAQMPFKVPWSSVLSSKLLLFKK